MSANGIHPTADNPSELRTEIARLRRRLDRRCRAAIDPLSWAGLGARRPLRSVLVAAALGVVHGLTSKRSPAAEREERRLPQVIYGIAARLSRELYRLARRSAKSKPSNTEDRDG